jgi:hypothetical protein
MNEEVEITLRFPIELLEKLQKTAELSGQTIQDVVRVLLAIVALEGVEDPHTDSNEV